MRPMTRVPILLACSLCFLAGWVVRDRGPAGLRADPTPPKQVDAPAELLTNQWAGEAEAVPVSFELAPLTKEDLVVHEWGVFTVLNDAKYANANRKEEWGSMPKFFYRQFPVERLHWVPSAWDKPVVYFYAKPTPLHLKVKVTFTEGMPVMR